MLADIYVMNLLCTSSYCNQGLIDSSRRRGHVTSNLAKFKSRLKIVEFLNMHSAANVTIISYKPLSGLNFTRYTQHYGSYMPSSPLESISPWS